ncbi:MAG: MFS transporter [Opitutaceae bacterium]
MLSPTPELHPTSSSHGELIASRFRWLIVFLLFLGTTVNYIDRQILALLKPILDVELGWTNEQYGWANSAFQAFYAFSYVAFGWLIDRVGIKFGYSLSMVAWSIATICHGFVGSVRGFFIARAALGLGEGGSFPSCIKAIAHWFPKRERAFAASLFNAGTNVGAILAPAIVPFVAYRYGWQTVFFGAGVAGLLWLIPWLIFFRNEPGQSPRVSRTERELIESDLDAQTSAAGKIGWFQLFTHRETWAIVLAKFLTDPVWWFFLIWLPDFFKKTRGLDIKNSWMHLVTIYSIATVLSIGGGWLSGHLINRGWSVTRARKTGMFIFALCVVPVIWAPQSSDWVAVVLIGLACAAHQAWSATIYASTSDMFPKRTIAAISGIGGMAGSVGGMLFPIFTGILLDHYKTTAGGESSGYRILFLICGGAYVLAFFVNHFFARRFEQIKLPASD